MNTKTTVYKIQGMPDCKQYATMPFGRQIEYRTMIANFKAGARSAWLSMKRQSPSKALREFVKMMGASAYFAQWNDTPSYRDDSFEVFFYAPKE